MHAPLLALPLLAAALACTASAAPRPEAAPARLSTSTPYAEAPLVEDSGRILVRVSIGGQDSLIFILDTAASAGIISPETRDLLGLDPASGQAPQVMGASGPTTLTRMSLPPVSVAGETVDGLNAVVTDMARFRRSEGPPYAGVLGADFLRHFDVEIDVPGGRLRLWRNREGSAPPAPPRAPANLANVAQVAGFVAFDAAVGDSVARAILDSGAHTSTLNWRAAAGAGVTRASPGLVASRSPAGVSGDIVESHSHRFDGSRWRGSASRRWRWASPISRSSGPWASASARRCCWAPTSCGSAASSSPTASGGCTSAAKPPPGSRTPRGGERLRRGFPAALSRRRTVLPRALRAVVPGRPAPSPGSWTQVPASVTFGSPQELAFEICLVHKRGGAQRVARPLAQSRPMRDAAQLLVDEREEPVHSVAAAAAVLLDQPGDLVGW